MQEKKRIPLKRLHRLRNARKQAAETDDLTPMMKAIKAVHSVTSTGSTQPEDLERQRAAQELFARLVTPNLLINTTPITVNNVSAEWVRMNQGHDRRHVVLYCHGGGYTCGQLGYARVLASKLALSTGCDVLSFEYRLAPEAPYPSAIDDAHIHPVVPDAQGIVNGGRIRRFGGKAGFKAEYIPPGGKRPFAGQHAGLAHLDAG